MSGQRARKGERVHRGRQVSEAVFARLWHDSSRTLTEIAAELDISAQAMLARARARGLAPRKARKPNRKIDQDILRQMYLDGVSLKAMADHFQVCPQRIGKTVAALGLRRPHTSRWHALSIEEWQALQLRRHMEEDAARCHAAMIEAGILYRGAA